jgi:hypothetical protein
MEHGSGGSSRRSAGGDHSGDTCAHQGHAHAHTHTHTHRIGRMLAHLSILPQTLNPKPLPRSCDRRFGSRRTSGTSGTRVRGRRTLGTRKRCAPVVPLARRNPVYKDPMRPCLSGHKELQYYMRVDLAEPLLRTQPRPITRAPGSLLHARAEQQQQQQHCIAVQVCNYHTCTPTNTRTHTTTTTNGRCAIRWAWSFAPCR